MSHSPKNIHFQGGGGDAYMCIYIHCFKLQQDHEHITIKMA